MKHEIKLVEAFQLVGNGKPRSKTFDGNSKHIVNHIKSNFNNDNKEIMSTKTMT